MRIRADTVGAPELNNVSVKFKLFLYNPICICEKGRCPDLKSLLYSFIFELIVCSLGASVQF